MHKIQIGWDRYITLEKTQIGKRMSMGGIIHSFIRDRRHKSSQLLNSCSERRRDDWQKQGGYKFGAMKGKLFFFNAVGSRAVELITKGHCGCKDLTRFMRSLDGHLEELCTGMIKETSQLGLQKLLSWNQLEF